MRLLNNLRILVFSGIITGIFLGTLAFLIININHPAAVVLGETTKAKPTPTVEATPTSTPPPTPTPTPIPTPTDTPTPTPTPWPVTSSQLDSWFDAYAHHYSVDRNLLFKIAACESELKPNAKNGPYGGMYQFSSSSWQSTRAAMNEDGNPDLRFNPEESIKTAAFKISTAGPAAWPNCK